MSNAARAAGAVNLVHEKHEKHERTLPQRPPNLTGSGPVFRAFRLFRGQLLSALMRLGGR
jgi:hypothetical protein